MDEIMKMAKSAENDGKSKLSVETPKEIRGKEKKKTAGVKPKEKKLLKKNPVTGYLSDDESKAFLKLLDGRPVATRIRSLVLNDISNG